MSEKLKTTVTYMKTYNLGNYESVKLGITKETYDEHEVEDIFYELAYTVDKMKENLTR
ncbi:MAG: hypothetical protein ACTSPB_11970 [Candidatus Thorarchaeota archaeon]